MPDYTIITENDSSQWNDETGSVYHYPFRYKKFLMPGTKVIYYKGKMKDRNFLHKRLTPEPHYFGMAEVGDFFKDENSSKNDFYCHIINFIPFSKSVPIKIKNELIEKIPNNRKTNYWRDGVRKIDKKIYETILFYAGINSDKEKKYNVNETNDLFQGTREAFESYGLEEGKKKYHYSVYYERNPKLRLLAILIHGYDCQVCKFNFKEFYGEIGEGFIHIHHLKPISINGKNNKVNAKEDLAALCANCHSMVHRYTNKTISIEELKKFIEEQKNEKKS